MKNLKFSSLSLDNELAWPTDNRQQRITLKSSALEVFTDFSKVEPQVVDSNTTAVEARKLMIQAHVRLKFIVDKNDHFIGVISTDDLLERKIVQQVALRVKRDEIMVVDLMRPKRDLVALDINEIQEASIGDVVALLQNSHQQHCLVQDADNHVIRGIFSASDISRKLKLPIEIQESSSFSEVFKAVA